MRTIIAGSRGIHDYALVEQAILESGFDITTVVCGGAQGIDTLGEIWAKSHGIPIEYYIPQWQTYGKSAGMRRNRKMADNADALIVIILDDSRGSVNMLAEAKDRDLKIYEKRIYS